MALSTGRLGLVVLLCPLAVFYLWCARQGLKVCWQYWHWNWQWSDRDTSQEIAKYLLCSPTISEFLVQAGGGC
ncbi:MAG: hypothetical protein AAGN15_05355 [Cyanobacteria bacterium J06581_3]